MELNITPADARSIQTASPEEIIQMHDNVVEIDKLVSRANVELQELNNSLDELNHTITLYNERKSKCRQKMQSLSKKLI